jgi:hypothetical protein
MCLCSLPLLPGKKKIRPILLICMSKTTHNYFFYEIFDPLV